MRPCAAQNWPKTAKKSRLLVELRDRSGVSDMYQGQEEINAPKATWPERGAGSGGERIQGGKENSESRN